MSTGAPVRDLRMIPVDRIKVINPRERNGLVFGGIVDNIQAIGLKKPVTVTPRPGADGAESYLLVCGEGRFKAFCQLGETRIPALVVAVSDEDAFIIGLAENIARRKYNPLDLLTGITDLDRSGHSAKEIAAKTGLSTQYVYDILTLVARGEERLLASVGRGQISLSAALKIVSAGNDDKAVQLALQEAYETGQLRGRQLLNARRLIQQRQIHGRSVMRSVADKPAGVTASNLVRAYRKEAQRQQLIVRKSSVAQQRLLFVVGALRELFADEHFCTLLRAEGLDSLPRYLAERVAEGGNPDGSLA
ncbi:plasmid partitioning protein RepB C-terminal domain-containing protein [Variovorax rhizosphaerae]|uniref:Plasmid partitioning protein RepB C-terminal domain-containing protein n=1 Tax=Variovorax rhizosphaerae TaxID=1836200 RepID=A0ABU8X1Z1_9BURK